MTTASRKPATMMLRRPIRSDSAPNTTKNGAASTQRHHHHRIHRGVVELHHRGEIEQHVERLVYQTTPSVRWHRRARAASAASCGCCRKLSPTGIAGLLALRLQLREQWRFLELQADLRRGDHQHAGDQERNAPAPGGEGLHRRAGCDTAGSRPAPATMPSVAVV